jgi:hypothetical protein
MSKPQSQTVVPFVQEWRIKRPFVYRYLDRQYTDQFFEDGTLRLSSFSMFSKHLDEPRKDSGEGWASIVHRTLEGGGQAVIGLTRQGLDAYVLCGSTVYSPELSEVFKANSGFRINDTTAFAHAIARHIPQFMYGCEGLCQYVSQRIVLRDMGSIDLSMSNQEMMTFLNQAAGDDLLFLKNQKYTRQSEYRLLWFHTGETRDYIDIKCPDARQFCTKFDGMIAELEKL